MQEKRGKCEEGGEYGALENVERSVPEPGPEGRGGREVRRETGGTR